MENTVITRRSRTRRSISLAAAAAMAVGTASAQLPVTHDLVLWLDADTLALTHGDPVSTWADSSSSLNDFTQSGTARPTFITNGIGGKATVRFDGVDDVMSSTASLDLTSGLTIFIVARNAIRQNYNGLFRIDETAFGADSELEIFWQDGTTDNASGNAAYVVNRYGSPVGVYLGANNGPPVGGGYLYDVLASSSWATQRVNGAMNPFGFVNQGAGGNLPSVAELGHIGIGYGEIGVFGLLEGDISAVLVYDATLSVEERNLVASRLADNYGLSIPEPSALALLALAACAMIWRRR
jgi:hypothetical protein